ncbi:MAG: hypothetical protein KC535_02200 [Nanoarchaeota archaeon]|nr:hypothetical protein [Nanoarchaeota archaeon]
MRMKAKLLLYLSVLLILLSGVMAVGDTFGIVQGTLKTGSTISFEVYYLGERLPDTSQIEAIDGLYALTVTIPEGYSSVTLIPLIDGRSLVDSLELDSGQTKQLDFLFSQVPEIKPQESIASSFVFQPPENQKEIEDLQKGDFQEYQEDISVMPVPQIDKEGQQSKQEPQEEFPRPVASESKAVDLINHFFLNPFVLLSLAVIACLLIVLVLIKERRTKYL